MTDLVESIALRLVRSRAVSGVLGAIALCIAAVVAYLGLVVTAPDVVQGELVRIIYIHPAFSSAMLAGFVASAVFAALYLVKKTRRLIFDAISVGFASASLVFCAVSLGTGAIWGRGSWGVWWTWDARLTSTAIIFVLFVGYFAIRNSSGSKEVVNLRASAVAILAVVDIPIIHFSVDWWRTLHQADTLTVSPSIGGLQLFTMLLAMIGASFGLVSLAFWRARLEMRIREVEDEELKIALLERRSEITAADELERV